MALLSTKCTVDHEITSYRFQNEEKQVAFLRIIQFNTTS